MKSIRLKLILVLVAVCGIQALLVAGIVRYATVDAFDRFLIEEASDTFVDDVVAYLSVWGSLDDMDALFGPSVPGDRRPAPPRDGLRPERAGPGAVRPGGAQPPPFGIADDGGMVVKSNDRYDVGQELTSDDLSKARFVEESGLPAFYVLPPEGSGIELGLREEEYIRSADLAILWAVAASLMVALLIGFVSVRIYAQPLRDLTKASLDLAQGISGASIPVRTKDEVGQLTQAFNELVTGLEESRNARTQMTADVVHDLGTPITVIAGYLQAFSDGDMEVTPDRIDLVLKETKRLRQLVEDLRVISLMDSATFVLYPEATQIVNWATDLRNAFQPQSRASIELELSGPRETVWIDERRMTQAIGNLLSNAVRYTEEDDTIRIHVHAGDAELHISVEDSGSGIPPEKLPFIFDRFYRVDSSRNLESGESGLGLAIVRSIVELHGGSVTAESTPGKRTCFTIKIPQHAVDVAASGYQLSSS